VPAIVSSVTASVKVPSAGRTRSTRPRSTSSARPRWRAGSRSSKADVASDCTTNSIAGDTPVVLADGTTAAISTLAVGDLVLATDPLTGETSRRPIERGKRNSVRVPSGFHMGHPRGGSTCDGRTSAERARG